MPDISCIIVTFENEETIGGCLESVTADLNEFSAEIILIDNASTDNTLPVAHGFREKCSHDFRIIKNLFNLGFARAINQGIAASNGEFILLLNPDTVIHPGFFLRMVSFLRENPDVGIVAPQQLTASGSILPSCRNFPTHLSLFFNVSGLSVLFPKSRIFNGWKMGWFDHKTSRTVQQPMGACLLIRKSDVEKVGYMDEQFRMFFNDVDWCRRFLEAGKTAYFLADAKITHYAGHSVRRKPVRMIFSSHRAFGRYFKKYYRKWYWILPDLISSIILLFTACIRILLLPFCSRR
ncbi:hypothetical protein AMJ80_04805 [bacterium SM23_31]|nr:MAG: hypothetical protein AMJ80_04805 [bacterium SM23_31]